MKLWTPYFCWHTSLKCSKYQVFIESVQNPSPVLYFEVHGLTTKSLLSVYTLLNGSKELGHSIS